MGNRLFTIIEIALIGGLIAAVLYFGGVFDSKPAPTATPLVTVRVLTAIPTSSVVASEPTLTSQATSPPLTEPVGLIAFNTIRDGNTEIYTMHPDGSHLSNLTNNRADDYLLAWSPNGTRIAFFSTRTDWLELYVMDGDGSNVLKLSNTKESQMAYTYPVTWSPAGDFLIAQRVSPWVVDSYRNITFVDRIVADGSRAQQIYFALSDSDMWWVTLSPDGENIAMLTQGRDGYGVYATPLTADGLMELEPVSLACWSYVWMRDGKQITCSDSNIYFNITPGSTLKETLFTNVGSVSSFGLLWSPDGQSLLVRHTSDRYPQPELQKLTLYSRAGSHREVLPDQHLPADEYIVWSWAPDSQWITFTSKHFGQEDIFVVNAFDFTSLRQLTSNGGNNRPLWQP